MNEVTFFIFQKHSLFVPLKSFYPEALFLCQRNNEPHPLACFTHPTVANSVLIEPLVRRAHYVFEELWTKLTPKNQHWNNRMLYVYYRYNNRPDSIQAAVFSSNLEEPKVIIMNPYSFKKFSREGIVYKWMPTQDFLLMGSDNKLIV